MIRRSSIILIEALLGIVAGLVILGGIVLWRLSAEPVKLDFLTPHLEEAFSAGREERIEVGATLLSWAGDANELDLLARDVVVRGADGEILARLPKAEVTLSLRALLHGELAATEVGLSGVAIVLRRSAEGRIELGAPDGQDGATGGLDFVMERLADVLMVEDDPSRPLSFLQRVVIRDGRLLVNDRRLDMSWQASNVEIELRRAGEDLVADLEFGWSLGGRTAELSLGLDYAVATGAVSFDLAFAQLSLSGLAEVLGGGQLPLVDLMLEGHLTGSVDAAGRPGILAFEVASGEGEIGLEGLVEPPLPVRRLAARGTIEQEAQTVRLESLELKLAGHGATDGPTIRAAGRLAASRPLLAGDLAAELELSTSVVPVADLGRYWPPGVASSARNWPLENLTGGTVQAVDVDLAVQIPEAGIENATVERLAGGLNYRDLEVHFLRPLPPIVGVFGRASFDLAQFRFDADGGRLGEIAVGPASVIISGLDSSRPDQGIYETMTVDTAVRAPLRPALELLDHPRLDLLGAVGLRPEQASGRAEMTAGFEFPLMADLTFERIAIEVSAEIFEAGLRRAVLDRDVTDGRLTLDLTEAGLTLAGDLRLADIPGTATWRENFTDTGTFRTLIEATLPNVNDEGRARLGLALPDYLGGPLSASVNVTTGLDGRTDLQAALNLQETRLTLDPLQWSKAGGAPAEAHATVRLDGESIEGVEAFRIEGPGLLIVGTAEPGTDRPLARILLSELRVHRTELREVALDLTGDGPQVEIGGGTLDAYPYLREAEGDRDAVPATGSEVADPAPPAPDAASDDHEPLVLRSRSLDVLLIGEESRLEAVSLELQRTVRGWSTVTLDGQLPREAWNIERQGVEISDAEATTPRSVNIDFRPAADGSQLLEVSSNDFGAILRAFGVTDEIQGGKLVITGSAPGPLPGHPLTGRIESESFVVYDVPILARLMTLASFDGIASALGGEGITFQRLFGDFRVEGERFSTELMRAYGTGVGLTSEGSVDFAADEIDLQGTVVPAYTVNRILGSIPLLGSLLTGGEGEGFIAVVYEITGPTDAPKVTVNPLSALTPGFLRGIFTEGTDTPAEAIPEPPNR